MERYGMWVRRSAWAALVLAVAAGGAACGGAKDAESATAEEAAVVLGPQDVASAELSTLAAGVVLTGSLDPYRVVEVKAQVPGTVANLRVDRGQAVREGQVLATIEAEGIRSQATGARAGVAAAEASLALARRQLESAQTLYRAGAISEIEFKSAQTGYEAAQAQLAAARSQAAGAAEQAGRTVVRAPITGRISDRKVEGGEAVSPSQPLFTVVNSEQLELAGQVPVDQAVRLRQGQPVVFSLSAYPGQEFRGSVARIEPTADAATRQVGVYVRLPNPGGRLVGGIFATGRILVDDAAQAAVVVPAAAVRGNDQEASVFVIENGRIAQRKVTLGARDEARGVVAIASGLNAGEQVVVSPATDIQAGTRVTLAAQAGAPAATGTAQAGKEKE